MEFEFEEGMDMPVINLVNNLVDVELEHVEFYFKPKQKYEEAFATLQKLSDLIVGTRTEKIYHNYGVDEYDDFCDRCSVSTENYLNAIDIRTGTLNLERFVAEIGGADVVNKSNIRFYVEDARLQQMLNKARKNERRNRYKADTMISINVSLIPDYEKHSLTNFIMRDGICKIVVNTMELTAKANLKGIGKLLGTFADEITDIVYVDSRAIKEKTLGFSAPDIKYEKVKYKVNEEELSISDLRVPDDNAYLEYLSCDYKNACDEWIVKDIKIPLCNMDNQLEVNVVLHVDKEKQYAASEVFDIVKTVAAAVDNRSLYNMTSNEDSKTCDCDVFDVLLHSDWNIVHYILKDSHSLTWLNFANRPYEIEAALSDKLDKDIVDSLIGLRNIKDTDDCFERFFAEETVNQLLNRAVGDVQNSYDNDAGVYQFSCICRNIDPNDLIKLFTMIKENIAAADNDATIDVKVIC